MSRTRHERAGALFARARRLPPGDRTGFLNESCDGDAELRREVESLLVEHDEDAAFLEPQQLQRKLGAAPLDTGGVSPEPPRAIGPFRIIRVIGEGGMGVVYEAQQADPPRRVALKVVRPGMVTPSALSRFRHEAEMLGQLRHPGIAQIYQAGTEGFGGQPYFAMELVTGEPLLRYARANGLDLRRRLELLARICDALHHAHQKGIVHRDLHPANILVEDGPGVGHPKILDFGIARATEADVQTVTMRTDFGQLVGTVPYMSPEQASGDPAAIDIRSDIYSLGVVACELLTGHLPYPVDGKMIHEAVRIIREDDPSPLHTIDRRLRGDVETIVAKALTKEKDRRYQSAAEFAADIRRFLGNEPIAARPPSAIYRLSRFTRRHRAVVAGVAAVFVVLVSALVVISGLALSESRARQAQEQLRQRAEKEADIAKAANDFVQGILRAPNPWHGDAESGPARDIKVVDVLDAAGERIDASFEGRPEVEANARETLGATYMELGELEKSRPHLERAHELFEEVLGPDAPETIDALHHLARWYYQSGDMAGAESAWRRALDAARRVFGEENEETATVIGSLAMAYRQTGDLDKAEQLNLEALEIRRRLYGDDDPWTLQSKNNLALLYGSQHRYDEAEPLAVEVYEALLRLEGPENPGTLTAMNNLGLLYARQRRFKEAESIYRPCLELRRRVHGDEHPLTLTVMNNLALALRDPEDFDEAESLYEQVLAVQERTLGEDHPHTMMTLGNLAGLLASHGYDERAEPFMERQLAAYRRVYGDDHARTLVAMRRLADIYAHRHRFAEAQQLALSSYEKLLDQYGPDERRTRRAARTLADLYEAWGKPDEAAKWRDRQTAVD